MTGFTPDAPVLNEFTNHGEELAKAEAGVAAMFAKRNNRWYPKFHIASNGGWINDPNGLCYYKGRWHVFYQLHPYGTQWGPCTGVTAPPPSWSTGIASRSCSPRLLSKRRTACSPVPR